MIIVMPFPGGTENHQKVLGGIRFFVIGSSAPQMCDAVHCPREVQTDCQPKKKTKRSGEGGGEILVE